MRVAVLLCAIAACTGIPGDAQTLVAGGEPVAGYAWSGAGSLCCNTDGTENVGWQVWFTNTDFCPTRGDQSSGLLMILSPERVKPPSTALPALPSLTLPIHDPGDIVDPMAYMGTNDVRSVIGTLTLTTYGMDEIAGRFTGTGTNLDGKQVEVHGTFVAHDCPRIHD